MEKNLVLTQEEIALIEKRRQRAAKKKENDNKLIQEKFSQLPTLQKFLKLLGTGTIAPTQNTSTETLYYIKDLFLRTNGTIGYTIAGYKALIGEGDPMTRVTVESLNKIGGKKAPFNYTLYCSILKDRVVDFQVAITSPKPSWGSYTLLTGSVVTIYDSAYGSDLLFIKDLKTMRDIIANKVTKWCKSLINSVEDRVSFAQKELNQALNAQKELKTQFGKYYKKGGDI